MNIQPNEPRSLADASLNVILADLQCKAAHIDALARAIEKMLLSKSPDHMIIAGVASAIVMLASDMDKEFDRIESPKGGDA